MPACTLMSERLWATTSCSSRAMRSCSSLARSRASSSRARVARPTARSRRMRTISVVVASTSSHAARPSTAASSGASPVPTTAGATGTAANPRRCSPTRPSRWPARSTVQNATIRREVDGALGIADARRTRAWSRTRPRARPPGRAGRHDEARRADHEQRAPPTRRSRAECPGAVAAMAEPADLDRGDDDRDREIACGSAPGRGSVPGSATVIPATVGGAARAASSRTA